MNQTLLFSGPSALSRFRRERLLVQIHSLGLAVREFAASFEHYVQCPQELHGALASRLASLLDYGEAAQPLASWDDQWRVVPRLGTISPWSSKATEILNHCGLSQVTRVERGIRYQISWESGPEPSAMKLLREFLHDSMTETILPAESDPGVLFNAAVPQPLLSIPLTGAGSGALERANLELGLALSDSEIEYLRRLFEQVQRDPTDAELLMFAQANSEHCRHKIFNADWTIDGQGQDQTLFQMIRATHRANPQGTVVAYADNAAVLEGGLTQRFYPDPLTGRYAAHTHLTHFLAKVETHNHPTAIAPFPGAATGSGGEIRDEGATGRGAKPKAGLVGFMVSNLCLPGFEQPWERPADPAPPHMASPLSIMLEGPLGAAAFNNEFGRPNLAGFFRTLELWEGKARRGYRKPIMLAGGLGAIDARHAHKLGLEPGCLLVHLGGPGMRIGLGGGAASSLQSGLNSTQLDFDSVQRSNPEMQRRAQEVIDRCWQLGADNPILALHDVGAGGLSNAFPELVHGGGVGGCFDLRRVPSLEPGMSPREIWSNEAQERYVLALRPEQWPLLQEICAREHCPVAVVGEATRESRIVVEDPLLGERVVDMELDDLLGHPPRQRLVAQRKQRPPGALALDVLSQNLGEALDRVLRLPCVADKSFLITIGDRTVGGLCARDPCVGPWQVPVADVAVTLADFVGVAGEAFALGERSPLALLSGPASGRMAVGEALTNLVAAPLESLGRVRLSANWMAAVGTLDEDAELYDTVAAVRDLCLALGLSIPVGKDSLSMSTRWQDQNVTHTVTAPLSLVVTAFAVCPDVRATLTPELHWVAEGSELLLVDLGRGRHRLGGSALAQVYGELGGEPPDLNETQDLQAFFVMIQALRREGRLLAYHDRSDGGLLITLCEMLFCSRKGARIDISTLSPLPEILAPLFCEELGAVLQVARSHCAAVRKAFAAVGLEHCVTVLGSVCEEPRLIVERNGRILLDRSVADLHAVWSETSFRMQALRDDPDCAREEFARIHDARDPGLTWQLGFDPAQALCAPMIATGQRPPVAILREQGVNGQVEMAAAFDRAGFAAVDVHMSDIRAGRTDLNQFVGLVACGGFSYGDVLGAGEGWAKSILFNARARAGFAHFFERGDVFGLGVCNGCQMMSQLTELIPGARHWPRFARNRSEQFEARVVLLEVANSPSLFFDGMAGSRIPIPVAHGEGRAWFETGAAQAQSRNLVALRYVDGYGQVATKHPLNPNGSLDGIAGMTTPDGRFTICMPHPERAFRTVQMSWAASEWGEDSPWMRMFRNARQFVG